MTEWLSAGTLSELRAAGSRLLTTRGHAVLLLPLGEGAVALDNRCPHLGFPLARGSVQDGILTCHWHHARFDAASGCTFDPWADDVPTYPVRILADGSVEVWPEPRARNPQEHALQRLRDGLEHDLGLVLAKAAVSLQALGVPVAEQLRVAAEFGCTARAQGWASGLTILTAMANVLPALAAEDRAVALFHGFQHVASDCDGQPARRSLRALTGEAVDLPRLRRWFRRLVAVRDVQGAERTLRAAIAQGGALDLADFLFTAATDHVYLSGGHTYDFINKACEMLDHVGWEQAATVLPALLPPLCNAVRSEELASWRQPLDLVALGETLQAGLDLTAALTAAPVGAADELLPLLLGDDAAASLEALRAALAAGRAPVDLAAALARAAAVRVLRFHEGNEFDDWVQVLHTFTYCNAVHQSFLRFSAGGRSLPAAMVRGLFHGAMSVYLDRFLNVPPARLPRAGQFTGRADDPAELLALLDCQQQVAAAAAWVQATVLDHETVWRTFGRALVREDADFHTYQMYEAGWRQCGLRRAQQDEAGARDFLLATARYLAAHAPTPRALLSTVETAKRLQRGEALYAEE